MSVSFPVLYKPSIAGGLESGLFGKLMELKQRFFKKVAVAF